jgi:hypothetical protein
LDTLRLPRLYRSINWERLAQHSEPATRTLAQVEPFKALGSFTSVGDCIKRPSGFDSTTMALCLATMPPRGPTNDPTLLTYMLPLTIASTHCSNHSQCGFITCSQAQAGIFRSFRKQWPTLEIGAMPGRLLATACSTTRLLPWKSKLKSTSTTWTQLMPALDHVSLDSCSPELWRGLLPYKTCRGRLEHCARAGRRLPACCEESTFVRHHWKMSRDVRGYPS